MPLIKNKSTVENREFWSHVEAVAQAARSRNANQETAVTPTSNSLSENSPQGGTRPENCAPATALTEHS